MKQAITGQYEYLHRSGVGLDYFTSRIDRLTLYPTGRFTLLTQQHSRVAHAARSFVQGQSAASSPPQQRREGNYALHEQAVTLFFDDGRQEHGQFSWDADGVQIGDHFFRKVSDSTLLPPTERIQKDMDDIAKGLKIAGTLGGMALKVAKGIQGTLGTEPSVPPQEPHSASPASPPQAAPSEPPSRPSEQTDAVYCEQCGTRSRQGKRFCNRCGAPLT